MGSRVGIGMVAVCCGLIAWTWASSAHTLESVAADPTTVDFGMIDLGDSRTEVVKVSDGGASVEMLDVAVEPSPPFTIVANSCADAETASDECVLAVKFAPQVLGVVSGELEISTADGGATVVLAGTGRGALPPSTPGVTPTTDAPPTTSVGTTTPTSTPQFADAECDAQAKNARVTFQPEKEMRIGESERVEVAADIGAEGQAPPSISGTESTRRDPVALKCRIRARMFGNDFEVNPEDWQDRSFVETNVVTWTWDVTPTRTGEALALTLEIQGLVPDANGDLISAGSGFHYEQVIVVDAEQQSTWRRFNNGLRGFASHPVVVLLATTGVLTVAGRWLLQRLRSAPPRA